MTRIRNPQSEGVGTYTSGCIISHKTSLPSDRYSFAQNNTDTENVEENALFAKWVWRVRFENFENAWRGQKNKI